VLLSELINEHRVEYHALSNDEKDSILKEYEEHKATKTNGVRISTKSKVNDVTQTLKVIENEVCVSLFLTTLTNKFT
jgi:biotin-(acetyl-CoA carboxylase) ligase